MELTFLGGAREVGASAILLRIKNKNLLLDCGIRQGSSNDILPDFRSVQELGGVDAIIVSHAHMDHIGSLPIISKEYKLARIYMNNMTKDLTRVLFKDSLNIMKNREAEIPLYAEADVENMLDRVFTINYGVEFEIFDGIKLTFYPAGHIAGASCIYITCGEGSFFYSGDFSIFPQKSIDGAKIPKLRPDAAIFEGTYGDKLHSSRKLEEDRLIDAVKDCIDKKGKMLIPAFALGRSQEVLLILKKAINNRILRNVNVYVDGMIRQINSKYKSNPLYLKGYLGQKILRGMEPFYDDNIRPVQDNEERQKIIDSKECSIIISSSGMLMGGPSQWYAEKIAPLENGYIVITGYQDEESPGRKLLNLLKEDDSEKKLEVNGKIIPVKCTIENIGLSAHSDKAEIKALINFLSPKNVFLMHGEDEVLKSLANDLTEEGMSRVYVPKIGENVKVFIHNPRKQLKWQLKFTMNEKGDLNEENLPKLWDFVFKNYGQRFFTVEDLMRIWKGNIDLDQSGITNLQKNLIGSVYFENDMRRFFMFRARTQDEVRESLTPKKLKQNEVIDLAYQYFKEYNVKKISCKLEEEKVILNFDFPMVVPQSIQKVIDEFTGQTEIKVEINDKTNINAAEKLIRSVFSDAQIKKISFILNERKVVVKTDKKPCDFEKKKAQINIDTGFLIEIEDESKKQLKCNDNIYKSIRQNSMEQNAAMDYIDKSFEGEEFKPYKKSIKGKNLLKLSFISPVIGERYEKKLKSIADNTGWDIEISNSVNQNDVINLALKLCMENGVKLKCNPSFNPETLKVNLKVENGVESIYNQIKKEFDYKTGCILEW